ncbi:MAG: nicotinate phosphoribosyltransferase [Clostridiales bacterium]|nr:nicotinate phosphoribosyltransferase [Clostridiales bacterium]
MLSDFYEFTMANGYLKSELKDTVAYFDMYFRKVPDNGGYAIMAGLEQLIDYIKDIHFDENDIEFLKEKGFDEEFLDYLKSFKFECDIWAVPEGTPIFPNEPIITVKGPIIQAQFIETMILLSVNHQSLIATKANRIVRSALGREVTEYGARRAMGFDAAASGSRAAYIAGCSRTSNTLASKLYGIPTLSTMAHSWIQMFDSERAAFRQYAKEYPENCILLVDTYNTLKSGISNAIEAFKKELLPRGYRPLGIRIDSGDITYISKKARKMLDEAGFPDCNIIASNALDEYLIRDMLNQGAKVDAFIVGERLITAASEPVFGGVYKLCAIEEKGKIIPKIKLSDNVSKITTPCFKKVWRLFDRDTGKAIADVITKNDEVIDDTTAYKLFDPEFTWKSKIVENFVARPLLVKIFEKGKLIYNSPSLEDIRSYCSEQVATLWDEVTRFENPHNYYVDLSQRLWDEKNKLVSENSDN